MNKVIIFAGGVGNRMNSKKPKQFLTIKNKEILLHTTEIFNNCNSIDQIIIVMVEGWLEYTRSIIKKNNLKKVVAVVRGGNTGQKSIYNGLSYNIHNDDIVLIHDGVRPFITEEIILENIKVASDTGIAITGVYAKETLVLTNRDKILSIFDRDNSFIAKAPQTFRGEIILKAHNMAIKNKDYNNIDSCSLVNKYLPYEQKKIVLCLDNNIKITTPQDYYIAKAIFDYKCESRVL